jgi:hypothetical protein
VYVFDISAAAAAAASSNRVGFVADCWLQVQTTSLQQTVDDDGLYL